MAASVSHMGLCVSDLDRSLRFYCDGLGFEPQIKYDIGNEFAATMEIDADVKLVSQMIVRESDLSSTACVSVIGQ